MALQYGIPLHNNGGHLQLALIDNIFSNIQQMCSGQCLTTLQYNIFSTQGLSQVTTSSINIGWQNINRWVPDDNKSRSHMQLLAEFCGGLVGAQNFQIVSIIQLSSSSEIQGAD